MTRSSLSAVLVAIALGVPAAASAQDAVMTVRIGDLNLAGAQGPDIARHRIKTAASRFCGAGERIDLTQMALQRGCVAQMSRKASHQLDQAMMVARPGALQLASRGAK
ncbi:UrcA family protein [Phenylobacterium sp.]|uniref:UrcA family protein n=1 Tax=Phenylobacterium sp. TaxID=1871053 RepID=UPI0035658582